MESTTETPTPKYVIEYQATDEEGNPIGKPTHIQGDTPEEIFEKQKQAHISATRALSRQNKAFNDLRSRKLTLREQPVVPVINQEEQARAAATVSNVTATGTEKAEAIRQLGGISELEDRLQKAEAARLQAEGLAIGYRFARAHLQDYYPCDANAKTLNDFLQSNNLEFTFDNLEIAFLEVGDKLAKDPKLQAAVEQSHNEHHDDIAQPEQNKRQPGFGMQPGTGTGQRPVNNGTATGKMNKRDVLAKKKADPLWWKKVISDPALTAEVNAALARG